MAMHEESEHTFIIGVQRLSSVIAHRHCSSGSAFQLLSIVTAKNAAHNLLMLGMVKPTCL